MTQRAAKLAGLELKALYDHLNKEPWWDSGHLLDVVPLFPDDGTELGRQAYRLVRAFTDRPLHRHDGSFTAFTYAVAHNPEFMKAIAEDGSRRGYRWYFRKGAIFVIADRPCESCGD